MIQNFGLSIVRQRNEWDELNPLCDAIVIEQSHRMKQKSCAARMF